MGGFSEFVGNLTGGLIGESTAERAAKAGAAISEQAKKDIMAELDVSWEDIKGMLTPWLEEGRQGLSMYKQAIGAAPDAPVFIGFTPDIEDFEGFKAGVGEFDFDPTRITENPAYQFVLDQTMQQVNRAAAAGRGLQSGNRMAAIADYARGLASQEYENEFQRQLQGYQTNLGREMAEYESGQTALGRNLERMRDIWGTGEEAKARTFDVRNLLQRQKVSDTGYLASLGPTFATNLAALRDQLTGRRTGALSGYAAEQTAARLIPAQETMSFMGNLLGAGGAIAGGKLAGGGGLNKGWFT